MKRYALFAWPEFYPGGGYHDFRGSFDTVEEAETALRNYLTPETPDDNAVFEAGHIVEWGTGKIVRKGRSTWDKVNITYYALIWE